MGADALQHSTQTTLRSEEAGRPYSRCRSLRDALQTGVGVTQGDGPSVFVWEALGTCHSVALSKLIHLPEPQFSRW